MDRVWLRLVFLDALINCPLGDVTVFLNMQILRIMEWRTSADNNGLIL